MTVVCGFMSVCVCVHCAYTLSIYEISFMQQKLNVNYEYMINVELVMCKTVCESVIERIEKDRKEVYMARKQSISRVLSGAPSVLFQVSRHSMITMNLDNPH